MKNLLRTLACAGLLAISAAANATHYEFSYTTSGGNKIIGDFEGTAHGNLITGLSDFSVFIDGVPFRDNGNLNIWSYNFRNLSTPSQVSFDGKETYLYVGYTLFSDYIVFGTLGFSKYSDSFGPTEYMQSNSSANVFIYDLYSAARWQVTAVPEPTTSAMLLGGLALVGAVSRRRRLKQVDDSALRA